MFLVVAPKAWLFLSVCYLLILNFLISESQRLCFLYHPKGFNIQKMTALLITTVLIFKDLEKHRATSEFSEG